MSPLCHVHAAGNRNWRKDVSTAGRGKELTALSHNEPLLNKLIARVENGTQGRFKLYQNAFTLIHTRKRIESSIMLLLTIFTE